jgi:hypothetical protein
MTTHNVNFTKDEAVTFSFALDEAQKMFVSEICRIGRSRMPEYEKDIQLDRNREQLRHVTQLNDRIQRATQIRGY